MYLQLCFLALAITAGANNEEQKKLTPSFLVDYLTCFLRDCINDGKLEQLEEQSWDQETDILGEDGPENPHSTQDETHTGESKPHYEDIPQEGFGGDIHEVTELPIHTDEFSAGGHKKKHPHPIQVGSVRGIPGEHFPNYEDIPLTSFSCSDKPHIPGFYADLETGCQVFHVCFHNRRESFLCPVGTIFNQAILTCDFWYSSDCSMAPHFYEVNAPSHTVSEGTPSTVEYPGADTVIGSSGANKEVVTEGTYVPHKVSSHNPAIPSLLFNTGASHITGGSLTHPSKRPTESDLSQILKLLPIKAKVTVYPVSKKTKVEAVASIGDKVEKSSYNAGMQNDQIQLSQTSLESKPTAATYDRGIDPSIGKIIDDAFDIARKVIEQAGGFIPRRRGSQKVNKMETSNGPLKPLTRMNPRFIVKPGEAVGKIMYPKQSRKQRVNRNFRMLASNAFKHVSPLTMKLLSANYLRKTKEH